MDKNDTTLYLVYWRVQEVLKIGVTSRGDRLRKHARTGGQLIVPLLPHITTAQEREAQRHVGYAFDRAFANVAEGEPLLGKWALGFTECFKVPLRHTLGAIQLAYLGVRRGADEED